MRCSGLATRLRLWLGGCSPLSFALGENMNRKIPFTFYGDLLGISGYYKLNPKIAKEKLNEFYNTVFYSLLDFCQNNSEMNVIMFSDSLIIFGDDVQKLLIELQKVYIELLYKGLLLRGAIVKGALEFEPRLTIENFKKMLPKDDTLARAVGLESTKKGARLLIESSLAEELLQETPEWLTIEGYINNIKNDIPYNDILRRIAPTPEMDAYEYLYFWTCDNFELLSRYFWTSDNRLKLSVNYKQIKQQLKQIMDMLSKSITVHYKETIALLERCYNRKKLTKEKLNN